MTAQVHWLGEDGSSWRAFVAPEEGDRVRRSAFYALQDASDGPAKAAYAAVGRSAEPRRTRSPRAGATLGSRGLLEKLGVGGPEGAEGE